MCHAMSRFNLQRQRYSDYKWVVFFCNQIYFGLYVPLQKTQYCISNISKSVVGKIKFHCDTLNQI